MRNCILSAYLSVCLSSTALADSIEFDTNPASPSTDAQGFIRVSGKYSHGADSEVSSVQIFIAHSNKQVYFLDTVQSLTPSPPARSTGGTFSGDGVRFPKGQYQVWAVLTTRYPNKPERQFTTIIKSASQTANNPPGGPLGSVAANMNNDRVAEITGSGTFTYANPATYNSLNGYVFWPNGGNSLTLDVKRPPMAPPIAPGIQNAFEVERFALAAGSYKTTVILKLDNTGEDLLGVGYYTSGWATVTVK